MERKHDGAVHVYNEGFQSVEIERLQKIITGQQEENARLRGENRALQENNRQLRRDLMHDPLTGLKSRKYFDEYITDLYETMVNHPDQGIRTLSILYVDIDHFKKINDKHGHHAGDAILQKVGSLLEKHVRDLDVVARLEEEENTNNQNIAARLGGEEMGIILVNVDEEVAAKRAEQLRKIVETYGQCTISIGVAQYQHGLTPQEFLERADQAMYAAKKTGRNKVCRHSQLSNQHRGLVK